MAVGGSLAGVVVKDNGGCSKPSPLLKNGNVPFGRINTGAVLKDVTLYPDHRGLCKGIWRDQEEKQEEINEINNTGGPSAHPLTSLADIKALASPTTYNEPVTIIVSEEEAMSCARDNAPDIVRVTWGLTPCFSTISLSASTGRPLSVLGLVMMTSVEQGISSPIMAPASLSFNTPNMRMIFPWALWVINTSSINLRSATAPSGLCAPSRNICGLSDTSSSLPGQDTFLTPSAACLSVISKPIPVKSSAAHRADPILYIWCLPARGVLSRSPPH